MKILLLCLTLALFIPVAIHAKETSKPNIVYFLVDDMGYADCGFNGGDQIKTPNIDKLAKKGTILGSFYAQPVCSPTRAALLTGRLPIHTGVYHVVIPGAPWGLPLDERTLPQALLDAGYSTSICGKWHLGEATAPYRPSQRGFEHQYGHMMGNLDYFTHIRDKKLDWYRDDKPLEEDGYTTTLIAKEACKVIREQPADKPLFLYVPFNGIHTPYQVPKSYIKPYTDLPKPRSTVAGMLAAVDEAIGSIADAIEEKGLTDNTLIIFSSDNGGSQPGKATSNKPLKGGKGSIHEGGIRVAAFATWPGKIPAGATVDEPLHVIDWYPTILKLTGAPTGQKHAPDGIDIWPILTKGKKSPRTDLLLQGYVPDSKGLRSGDWKLVVTPKGEMSLYNLAEDISEKHDLSKSNPEKVKAMKTRLDEITKDAVEPGGPPPP